MEKKREKMETMKGGCEACTIESYTQGIGDGAFCKSWLVLKSAWDFCQNSVKFSEN